MNKKKIITAIVLIIITLLVTFLAISLRDFIIVKVLQNKIIDKSASTNYHVKSVTTDQGTVTTINYYKKDNKEACITETVHDGKTNKIYMYKDGNKVNTYTEEGDEKIAHLNTGMQMPASIYNTLETDNIGQTILSSPQAKIKSEKYKGKKCYKIENFFGSGLYGANKNIVYVEKGTGLLLKRVMDTQVTEFEYEFGNVGDEKFMQPRIKNYKVVEDK